MLYYAYGSMGINRDAEITEREGWERHSSGLLKKM